MVSEVIMRRLKVLEQEKERMLRSKQLVVKKNPLLDQRDDIHSRQNEKLVNRMPMNLWTMIYKDIYLSVFIQKIVSNK